MQSAAHCVNWANNHSVQFDGNPYNAGTYSGFIATLVGNPNTFGSSDRLLDATLIGVPATPSIAGEMFIGANASSTKADIPSIGGIPFNVTLCSNGSSTGGRCNVQRVAGAGRERIQICASACRWVDVYPVYTTNGGLLFGQGDSGGPVYRLNNRQIVATISSFVSEGRYRCGAVSWYYPAYNPWCSRTRGGVTSVTEVRAELHEQQPALVARVRP